MNKITRWEWKAEGDDPKPVCWQARLGSAKGRRPPIQDVPPSGLFPQLNTGTARGTTEAEERSLFSLWKENVLQNRSAFISSLIPLWSFLSLTSSCLNYHHGCLSNTFGEQRFQETTLADFFMLWRMTVYGYCYTRFTTELQLFWFEESWTFGTDFW